MSAQITEWFRSEVLLSKDHNPKWTTAPFLVGLCMTREYVRFNKPGSQGETQCTLFGSQVDNSWEALVSLVHFRESKPQCNMRCWSTSATMYCYNVKVFLILQTTTMI